MLNLLRCFVIRSPPLVPRGVGLTSGRGCEIVSKLRYGATSWSVTSVSRCIGTAPGSDANLNITTYKRLLNELRSKPFDSSKAELLAELLAIQLQLELARKDVELARADAAASKVETLRVQNLFSVRGLIEWLEIKWGPPARPRRTRRQKWQFIFQQRSDIAAKVTAKLQREGHTLVNSLPDEICLIHEQLYPDPDDYDKNASAGGVLVIVVTGPVSHAQASLVSGLADEAGLPNEVFDPQDNGAS